MAVFELNIYGNDDEITKQYETDHVRFGVFVEAFKIDRDMKKMTAEGQFQAVSAMVKKIFPGLTDAELENADFADVMNTFRQLMNKANALMGEDSSKNG